MERQLLENGCNIFIRYNEAVSIYRKVSKRLENSFSNLVSVRKPFGLSSDFRDFSKEATPEKIKIYANSAMGWVDKKQINQNYDLIGKYKIYISFAYGAGEDFPHQILNKPFLGEKESCCTETYLAIGPFLERKEAENALTYIKTKFFRFMVLLIKNTQHATKRVYSFVPVQDFSKPWTDAELYEKYGLNDEEIAFIESMIRPME